MDVIDRVHAFSCSTYNRLTNCNLFATGAKHCHWINPSAPKLLTHRPRLSHDVSSLLTRFSFFRKAQSFRYCNLYQILRIASECSDFVEVRIVYLEDLEGNLLTSFLAWHFHQHALIRCFFHCSMTEGIETLYFWPENSS